MQARNTRYGRLLEKSHFGNKAVQLTIYLAMLMTYAN